MKAYKTTYICQNCGAQYAKHQGKCHTCLAWNTIVEEIVAKKSPTATHWETFNFSSNTTTSTPKQLHEINYESQNRILCPDKEFSRTLGGGIVLGSLVLIGGEPGIGKSTLLLQIALNLNAYKALYVSGEESEAQIKMRASRINASSSNCYILNETIVENILQHATSLEPAIIVIDSIQTIYTQQIESPPGSVAQVRAATSLLMNYAKITNTPIFLIGHITKEGTLAGPKVLEHMVDTVLQFEGDRHLTYRIVRTIKNRFGATSELGIYEMRHNGLQEVSNPSALLLSQREGHLSGIATGAFIEGNRSLLVEVQALVSPATYGTPQRATTGFDSKRLNMLLAVLEKRARLRLAIHDVFLNIAGGIKVEDPALDLAVCIAIMSSLKDIIIPTNYCFAAEVGLGGEVRAVNRIEQRIAEASRLGFEQIFIASHNYKSLDHKNYTININPIETINEVVNYFIDLRD
ncbi:MAG: DNA repair protein RadA [Candidatus Amoebophilus sp.]